MIRKEWDLTKIRDRLQMQAIRLQRPLYCTMELTYRCNFRCRMCYVRMTDAQAAPYGRLRTPDEWLNMGRQVRDAGVLNLVLTGGECTQYPGFCELYEQLARMGFRISVMSNAGAWTDDVRDVLSRYPPTGVGVTLYGGCDETYAAVTGDPRGFSKVIDNLRFLRTRGIPFTLCFTIIRQNAPDYPKVGQACRELGVPYSLITDICPHRHCEAFSEALSCRLMPAERACVALHPPEEVGLALENAKELEKELEGFRMPAAPAEPLPPEQDSCMSSQIGCAICWNGEMQPCVSLYGCRSVHPFETGFEAAWAQLKAQQEETFRRPAVCQACGMAPDCLHTCAGRRFEGTGSPHEPDPYTCQYTYLLRLYRAKRSGADLPPTPPCA